MVLNVYHLKLTPSTFDAQPIVATFKSSIHTLSELKRSIIAASLLVAQQTGTLDSQYTGATHSSAQLQSTQVSLTTNLVDAAPFR
jgi:hypothetical protein